MSGRAGGVRIAVGEGMGVSVGAWEAVAVGVSSMGVIGVAAGEISVGAAQAVNIIASKPRVRHRSGRKSLDMKELYQNSPDELVRRGYI